MNDSVIQPVTINLSHIRAMTIQHGEAWGYPHVCRLLQLIGEIGEGLRYDEDVILYAAYLHDWGLFPRYRQAGMTHALRSMQVVEREILPFTALAETARQKTLQAIALHDPRDLRPAPTPEALLLREAETLDMLETLPVLGNGEDALDVGGDLTLQLAEIAERLSLPRSRTLAAQCLAAMQNLHNPRSREIDPFSTED